MSWLAGFRRPPSPESSEFEPPPPERHAAPGLAQALAWLEGRSEALEEDVFASLAWSLPHRLAIRPEELRKSPNEQAWIEDFALAQVLTPRRAYWDRALAAFDAADHTELEKLGLNDLVVRELALLLDQVASGSNGRTDSGLI